MMKLETINAVIGALVSTLTVFAFFQGRMTIGERRTTILEEKDKQFEKEVIEIKKRLDDHDKQNEVLIRLTAEIANLSEKVEKIDKKLEEVK